MWIKWITTLHACPDEESKWSIGSDTTHSQPMDTPTAADIICLHQLTALKLSIVNHKYAASALNFNSNLLYIGIPIQHYARRAQCTLVQTFKLLQPQIQALQHIKKKGRERRAPLHPNETKGGLEIKYHRLSLLISISIYLSYLSLTHSHTHSLSLTLSLSVQQFRSKLSTGDIDLFMYHSCLLKWSTKQVIWFWIDQQSR